MRASYPKYKSTSIPWLPKLPVHWEIKKLKYVAKIQFSNVDKLSHDFEEKVELCNYTDVYYNDFITDSLQFMKATATLNEIRKFKLEIGDVLVTKDSESRDDIAVSALVVGTKSNLVCGYHLAQIKPKSILGNYLFRVFQSHELNDHFEINANGVTRYAVGMDAFYNFYIPLPPLPEQTAIANYLDAKTEQINRFIEKKEKLIALLKEQKQAVINELLEDKEGKWERRKLKYLVSMKSGNFIDANDINDYGDFLVYGGNGIRGFAKNYTHEGEYVLIGRQGALCGNVNFASGKFWPSEHAIVCTPKIKIDTFWFGNAVRSLNLGQYSQSAAQPGISIGVVSNVAVCFPDYESQLFISEQIKKEGSRIDQVVNRIEKEIEKVKELKQSLIAEVVTGRIKVA